MKKNDKIIVVLGVVVLVLASIGVYYYDYGEKPTKGAEIEDFLEITTEYQKSLEDNSIVVSSTESFYPLIVTPLAVHYNNEGDKEVVPLYVQDFSDTSISIKRLQDEYLNNYKPIYFNHEDFDSAEDFSLLVAEKYWKKTDAAIIIEDSEEGYSLGVNAVPMASYLGIPVIVTDEVDVEVQETLNNLKVEKVIVCGDTLEGYQEGYNFLKFDTIDQIVENVTNLVYEKFGDVNYITLTNPRDAYPPRVLNTTWVNASGTASVKAFVPSALRSTLASQFGSDKGDYFEIKIPEGWDYVKLTMDIINEEDPENIEKFGDSLALLSPPTGVLTSVGSPPITNEAGEIKNDRLYFEDVYYDYGGESFTVRPSAVVLTGENPSWTATVKIEQLEDPYDPLLPKVSSLAPYLTAYRKGIIFAKPDFAFANERGRKLDGRELPGSAQPKMNPEIIPLVNQHVYNNIHKPLNQLLANIKDIDISDTTEYLKKACDKDRFNICIIGGTTMMPQYYYRNPHNNPFTKHNRGYGTNTPSDFIYGNIDPDTPIIHPTTTDYTEDDKFSELQDNGKRYPTMENIVGRITGGFDIQDTSALIARTIFYDDVLDSLNEEWKNKGLVMAGAGLEFQELPIFKTLYDLANAHEPMKFPTGQQHFLSLRTKHCLEENGGFEVEKLERGQAQRVGFSDEALDELKKANILGRLFPKRYIKIIQGYENIKSLTDPDWWRTINDDGSGIHGGESQENSNLIQVNAHGIFFDYSPGDVLMYSHGVPLLSPLLARYFTPFMPMNPRSGLEGHGGFAVREVSLMDMGPSVMFVECCGGGKIDSLDPYNTLSAAYLHSGVNAFICPTTFSAISGYLEPKKHEVGLGIKQYLMWNSRAKKHIYPETEFCGWMFEHSYKEMFENDATIGEALTEARNKFLKEQFGETYLWTPPLNHGEDNIFFKPGYTRTAGSKGSNVPVEKYAAIFQLNLLGDPAFNPYQPCNKG